MSAAGYLPLRRSLSVYMWASASASAISGSPSGERIAIPAEIEQIGAS